MNFRKLKWMFGILFVFFLILATNLIDQTNFNKIQASVETIYEDRVVAQGIVYDMTTLMHEKEIANALSDSGFYLTKNSSVDAELDQLLEDYAATKLTEDEAESFQQLQQNITLLKESENKSANRIPIDKLKHSAMINTNQQDLLSLADIQVTEAKREMVTSKKAVQTSELFTQMEIYGLISLAIILQLLIIAGPRKKNEALN